MILNRRCNIEPTFACYFLSLLWYDYASNQKRKVALHLQLLNVISRVEQIGGVALNDWTEERRRQTSTGFAFINTFTNRKSI